MTADDLANFLESVTGRTIYTNYLPEQVDDVVMARFTGGPRDAELPTIRQPSFQVIIRDSNPIAGEALALQLEAVLHTNNFQVGAHMCSIYSKSEMIPLGPDDKQRHRFSLNFEMIYQE